MLNISALSQTDDDYIPATDKHYRFIPLAYMQVVNMPEMGLTIYHGSSMCHGGKPTALRFVGKSSKPRDHYRYNSEAERADADSKFIAQTQEVAAMKAKDRAERKALKATPHTLKVGDIMVSSWGYEQTNVDFYQVVGLRGSFIVQLRQICKKECESTGYLTMAGMCIADKDSFLEGKNGEMFEKRVHAGNRFNLESYSHASQWDGKPTYYSWYA